MGNEGRMFADGTLTDAQWAAFDEIVSRQGGDAHELGFLKQLEHLINRYSVENVSDTPDFILASYVNDCLSNFANTVRERDKWFGFNPWKHEEPLPHSSTGEAKP